MIKTYLQLLIILYLSFSLSKFCRNVIIHKIVKRWTIKVGLKGEKLWNYNNINQIGLHIGHPSVQSVSLEF